MDRETCFICFNFVEESEVKSLDISKKLINVYSTFLHSAITSERLRKMEELTENRLCEDCFNSALELKNLTDQLNNYGTRLTTIVKKTMDTLLEFSLQILCHRTKLTLQAKDLDSSEDLIKINVPKGFGLLFSQFLKKDSVIPTVIKEENVDIVYESFGYGYETDGDDLKTDPFLETSLKIDSSTSLLSQNPILLPEKIGSKISNTDLAPQLVKATRDQPINNLGLDLKPFLDKVLKIHLTRLQFGEDGRPVIPTTKEETTSTKLKTGNHSRRKRIRPSNNAKRKHNVSTLIKMENMNKIRQKSSGFECRFCWVKHVKWEDHVKHIEEAHQRRRQFQCYACDKSFSQKHHMDTHVRIHTGEKPFECSFCSKRFSDQTAHYRHTKIHTGEKKYRCDFCSYGTSDSGAFGRHKLIHSNDYEFKCKLCKKQFRIRYNYMMHLKSHAGERPFECSVCRKRFASKGSLQKHMRIHTGEKPFKCNICNKSFAQKPYLVAHLRLHTGEKPYKCDKCDKSFSNCGTLWLHRKKHEKKLLKCNLCKYTTFKETDFQQHGKNHKQEKKNDFPFKCQKCGQYFKRSRTLRVHFRRFHTSVKTNDKSVKVKK